MSDNYLEIRKLNAEIECLRSQLVRASKFVKWAMQEGPWDGCELDGYDVQSKALELGLVVRTEYDPEKHGEDSEYEIDAGDEWFVLAPEIAAAALTDEQGNSDG